MLAVIQLSASWVIFRYFSKLSSTTAQIDIGSSCFAMSENPGEWPTALLTFSRQAVGELQLAPLKFLRRAVEDSCLQLLNVTSSNCNQTVVENCKNLE